MSGPYSGMTSRALHRFTRAELLDYAIKTGAPASLSTSRKETIVREIQKGFVLSRTHCQFCHIESRTMANGTVRIGIEPDLLDSDDEAPDRNEADIRDHTQYCTVLQSIWDKFNTIRLVESRKQGRELVTEMFRIAASPEGQVAICQPQGRRLLASLQKAAGTLVGVGNHYVSPELSSNVATVLEL